MKNKMILCKTVLILCFLFTMSLTILAQAGALDLTFGNGGVTTTSFGNLDDFVRSVVMQNDGKIVVVGHTNGSNDIAIARYNTNGSLDTTFDSDGMVTTSFSIDHDNGISVAIQNDGKILVSGEYDNGSFSNDIILVRYNINGSLDSTFSSDGIVTTTISTSNETGSSVAIQPDGKILVGGHSTDPSYGFLLVRYNTNGNLDSTFDADGIASTSFGNLFDLGYSIALQNDGKIVLAGLSYSGIVDMYFAIARFNTNGSLDTTFDNDGKVTTLSISADVLGQLAVAIQSDGKIVVAGDIQVGPSNNDFAIFRYNANGSLDTTFDTDGKVTTSFGPGNEKCYSVIIQPDGKIISAGVSRIGANDIFAIARFNINGSLDTTFDADGKVTTAIGSFLNFLGVVVMQSDGKLVLAGGVSNGTSIDFSVVRYTNNITTGIYENNNLTKELVIYPNPCSTYATINSGISLKEATLAVYNSVGQEVIKINKLSGENIKFNCENLPVGIYYIRLIERNQIISTNKFVITD